MHYIPKGGMKFYLLYILFQRLLLVAKSNELNLKDILKYVMCALPPSLLESQLLLRKPVKVDLSRAIPKLQQIICRSQTSIIICSYLMAATMEKECHLCETIPNLCTVR